MRKTNSKVILQKSFESVKLWCKITFVTMLDNWNHS